MAWIEGFPGSDCSQLVIRTPCILRPPHHIFPFGLRRSRGQAPLRRALSLAGRCAAVAKYALALAVTDSNSNQY